MDRGGRREAADPFSGRTGVVHQKPGDFEKMQTSACTRMLGCHLIEDAGHWVQQEQPEKVTELLLRFVGKQE